MGKDLYENFEDLHAKKAALEAKIDNLKDEIAAAEMVILRKWEEEGVSSVKLATGRTVYLDHKIWASADGDTDRLCEALEADGFADMVKKTVNRNTLSKWVREHAPSKIASPDEVAAELPPTVRQVIKVTETNNVRVRGI